MVWLLLNVACSFNSPQKHVLLSALFFCCCCCSRNTEKRGQFLGGGPGKIKGKQSGGWLAGWSRACLLNDGWNYDDAVLLQYILCVSYNYYFYHLNCFISSGFGSEPVTPPTLDKQQIETTTKKAVYPLADQAGKRWFYRSIWNFNDAAAEGKRLNAAAEDILSYFGQRTVCRMVEMCREMFCFYFESGGNWQGSSVVGRFVGNLKQFGIRFVKEIWAFAASLFKCALLIRLGMQSIFLNQ